MKPYVISPDEVLMGNVFDKVYIYLIEFSLAVKALHNTFGFTETIHLVHRPTNHIAADWCLATFG